MNRARLKSLGFELGHAFGGRSQGAWFATAADGSPVVLKWTADPAMADRYAALIPGLDALRARRVPVPQYREVIPMDDGILSIQQFLPGQPQDNPSPAIINAMMKSIAAKAGIAGPPPPDGQPGWGAFVVRTLTVGRKGWGMHEPLRSWDPHTAAALDRIKVVGAGSNPDAFPDDGLVHLDLHTDNVLTKDETLTGIIDWEEACAGDHLYDLVQYAFDLDGHGQPVWHIVDATGFDPQVLRAYIAFLVLKCTSSAIVHDPGDVPRQLDRANRVFGRYGI